MNGKTIRANVYYIAISLSAVLFISFILIFPNESRKSVITGLAMCGEIVIPSLFPFTCAAMIISTTGVSKILGFLLKPFAKYILKTDTKVAMIYILSLFGGYPVGAKLTARMVKNNELSKKDAENILSFSVNAGPAFVIVAVGSGFMHNEASGWKIFASTTLASLIIAITACRIYKPRSSANETKYMPFGDATVSSICETGISMITISSFTVFFTCFRSFTETVFGKEVSDIISIFAEVTGGSAKAASSGIPLTAFCIAFGGIAVHFQIMGICSSVKVNYLKFFASRLMHGLLSFFIALFIKYVFPTALPTVAYGKKISEEIAISGTSSFSLALMAMTAVMMIYIYLCISEKKKAQTNRQ